MHVPMIPFSLDEGPNPQGHIQTLLVYLLDEFYQIIPSFEIVLQFKKIYINPIT